MLYLQWEGVRITLEETGERIQLFLVGTGRLHGEGDRREGWRGLRGRRNSAFREEEAVCMLYCQATFHGAGMSGAQDLGRMPGLTGARPVATRPGSLSSILQAMAPCSAIVEQIQVGTSPSPRNAPQRLMSCWKSVGNVSITCKEQYIYTAYYLFF